MKKWVLKLFGGWLGSIFIQRIAQEPLIEATLKAKKEWLYAVQLFNEIEEKELVDYAIYNMNAAERHYIYLLDLCQREGLNNCYIHIN